MEEALSLIIQGCKLAKDLESNLLNLANQLQPDTLSNICDEIIRTFTEAKQRLNLNAGPIEFPTLYSQPSQIDPGLQEWVRAKVMSTSTTELLRMQLMAARGTSSTLEGQPGVEMGPGGLVVEFGGGDVKALDPNISAARASSSSQRPRKRKNDAEKITVLVSAPQMGNTEIPPDDGFTWRKYGQKEILGARFPRGYYRCTHQKLYNCPAKKQVQRLDEDPNTFEVSYRGRHTCHMTATAPEIPPPAKLARETPTQTQVASTQPFPPIGPSSSSSVPGGWFGLNLGAIGTSTGTSAAGPSTSSVRPYGKETSDLAVADLADTMFNSGSSSSTSMDFFFSQNVDQDKWDPLQGEKKSD